MDLMYNNSTLKKTAVLEVLFKNNRKLTLSLSNILTWQLAHNLWLPLNFSRHSDVQNWRMTVPKRTQSLPNIFSPTWELHILQWDPMTLT